MRNVTNRISNPFGMDPDCAHVVPGYGDANADFHVIGDHPGIHGGLETGIPFTDTEWSPTFIRTLADAGILHDDELVGDERDVATLDGTFLSYLHMCAPDEGTPSGDSYANLERFFDAELRAIAAHVLLPVGERATAHVLETYTAQAWKTDVDMDELHGTEIRGAGWLVVPIKDPARWEETDARQLVAGIAELRRTDYRRTSDLGRFIAGNDPYLVR